jgi:hypothetical protein
MESQRCTGMRAALERVVVGCIWVSAGVVPCHVMPDGVSQQPTDACAPPPPSLPRCSSTTMRRRQVAPAALVSTTCAWTARDRSSTTPSSGTPRVGSMSSRPARWSHSWTWQDMNGCVLLWGPRGGGCMCLWGGGREGQLHSSRYFTLSTWR